MGVSFAGGPPPRPIAYPPGHDHERGRRSCEGWSGRGRPPTSDLAWIDRIFADAERSHAPAADFADTAPGNLRADYVLPSRRGLRVLGGAVFWPLTGDPRCPLVGTFPFPSSDHRLVYLDLAT
jgi:hypothetical protein